MSELAVRNVEYGFVIDFPPLGLRREKDKLSFRIDKLPDQPRTGYAIDLNFFARAPFHAGISPGCPEHPTGVFPSPLRPRASSWLAGRLGSSAIPASPRPL